MVSHYHGHRLFLDGVEDVEPCGVCFSKWDGTSTRVSIMDVF